MKKIISILTAFIIVMYTFPAASAEITEQPYGENLYNASPVSSELDLSSARTQRNVTLTKTEDGLLYEGQLDANKTSGWISFPNLDIDGSKCFKIKFTIKVLGAEKPTDWNAPYAAIYYTGVTSAGESLGEAGSRFTWFDYGLDEDNTTGGKFKEYVIDTSKLSRWDECKITSLRFEAFKNAPGTAVIQSIKLISGTDITEIGYNGQKNIQTVSKNAQSVEAYLSEPVVFDSVTVNTAKIIDFNGNDIAAAVKYDEESNCIIFRPESEFKANKTYTIELDGLRGNSKTVIDKVKRDFSITPGDYEINNVSFMRTPMGEFISIDLQNNTENDKELLVTISAWDGNEFVKGYLETVDVPAGRQTNKQIMFDPGKENTNIELAVWDNDYEIPVVISDEMYSQAY